MNEWNGEKKKKKRKDLISHLVKRNPVLLIVAIIPPSWKPPTEAVIINTRDLQKRNTLIKTSTA